MNKKIYCAYLVKNEQENRIEIWYQHKCFMRYDGINEFNYNEAVKIVDNLNDYLLSQKTTAKE